MSIMPDWYDAWKLQSPKDKIYLCESCGQPIHPDELVGVYSVEGFYCKECFNEEFTQCRVCNRYYHDEDMHSDPSMEICIDCFKESEENENDTTD